MEQYRRCDSEQSSAELCRYFLTGKIANTRRVLQRALSDYKSDAEDSLKLKKTVNLLKHIQSNIQTQNLSLDALRGREGEAAAAYFEVFPLLIRNDGFQFVNRNRRPPMDPVNCLLSFIYTLLVHDVRSALECVGLDPAVGFLHRPRPGRPSLALDMMEEFRSFFADRLVLSLINRKQLKPTDFVKMESGAVKMKDDARKTVLTAYQNRKKEEIIHPFVKEKTTLGLLWHTQALLLARYLRNCIMMVLVSYDVSTIDKVGRRRLRRVAKACEDYGLRVQYSIFECSVDPAQWVKLKARLLDIVNLEKDSLRFYYLGSNWQKRVEHFGAKPGLDIEGPLIL
jgi:CRISPR-associated protein Cas1